jgi:hypothetical protein
LEGGIDAGHEYLNKIIENKNYEMIKDKVIDVKKMIENDVLSINDYSKHYAMNGIINIFEKNKNGNDTLLFILNSKLFIESLIKQVSLKNTNIYVIENYDIENEDFKCYSVNSESSGSYLKKQFLLFFKI